MYIMAIRLYCAYLKMSKRLSQKRIVTKKNETQSSILNYFRPISHTNQSNENNVTNDVQEVTIIDKDTAENSKLIETSSDDNAIVQPTKVPKLDLSEDEINSIFEDSCLDFCDNNLDLTQWQHCVIDSVTKIDNYLKVLVKCTKSSKSSYCNLKGVWCDIQLETGCTVSLKAKQCTDDYSYEINDLDGLLIINPDHLLSSTSILRSLFCKRREILCERFCGFDPTPILMLIGTILHTVVEDVIASKNYEEYYIRSCINAFVNNRNFVLSLYGTGISINDLRRQIEEFVPKIMEFIDKYIVNKTVEQKNNYYDFVGFIKSIEDIEENIWLPELGLKARIDFTVKAFDRNTKKEFIAPLELKTGKVSQSLEHRGQVALYILMLDQIYGNVDSGLLLYLRNCFLQHINVSHSEIRDIIKIRNELTHILLNSNMDIEAINLPQPIEYPNACKKCPYITTCATYARYENNLNKNHDFYKISKSTTQHLTQSDIDYFIKWSTVLTIEFNGFATNKPIKNIWLLEPDEREKQGKAISNVEIVDEVTEKTNSMFLHRFRKIAPEPTFLIEKTGLEKYQYVIVSSDQRYALGAGYIVSIDGAEVTINLERNLQKKYPTLKKYHIDTYESHNTYTFSMGNLALLIENNVRSAHLRRLIIDEEPAQFSSLHLTPLPESVHDILNKLNTDQQCAIMRVLKAQDYVLIKGMAGTGKTSTIVSLIEILSILNKSIIITSHTHSAIDNICVQLIQRGIKLMRLGSERRIHSELGMYSEAELIKECDNIEDLERVYDQTNIVAVTCYGGAHLLFSNKYFDYCIIDESTQVLQVSLIRLLMAARVFVLVGDPHQLPPLVKTKKAIQLGMNESLFKKLENSNATTSLCLQYRMNSEIMMVANKFTYKNQLQCANDLVQYSTVRYENFSDVDPWLNMLLDRSMEGSFRILDTGSVWKIRDNYTFQNPDLNKSYNAIKSSYCGINDDLFCINHFEAALILRLIQQLSQFGVSLNEVGVIAPYRAQIELLKRLLLPYNNVEINTIDQYQGRDKEIIIYSCTKSAAAQTDAMEFKLGILSDKKRLTVAITRAKHKFIMLGDMDTLRLFEPFKNLFSVLRDDQILHLSSYQSFDWNSVFQ